MKFWSKKIFGFSEEGQSLVEVIAALAVVVIVLLSLVTIVTISVRNSSFSRNQSLATKYAVELIEDARRLRDTQEEKDFFKEGSCNASDAINVFHRTRTCSLSEDAYGKTITVEVVVWWMDSQGRHQSQIQTRLTNWK